MTANFLCQANGAQNQGLREVLPLNRRGACLRSTLTLVAACAVAFTHNVILAQTFSDSVTLPMPSAATMTSSFEHLVRRHLAIPVASSGYYATLLSTALTTEGAVEANTTFVVLVDRNPNVQALFLFLGTTAGGWNLIGASAISTGLPGKYEHFKTPLGVFDHSRENPDFRAEGTKNQFGIRGYGSKGGRIYDFGWVKAPRGWGDGHMGELRLQMHSTDRDALEQRLGTAQSEGCIRMPAELNEFLDVYGILDHDYESVIATGNHPWVLRKDRIPTPWSGRYLVVVESDAVSRPEWAQNVMKSRSRQEKSGKNPGSFLR